MATGPRLVFFGNERLATGVVTTAPILRALIDAGYDVVAVIANHHAAHSRHNRELEIETVAREHSIPVWLPDRPSDVAEKITATDAVLGVLVAYGRIVPQSVIDLFPCGIINLHPSLLPLHRGSTPIESVLLSGASQTAVSIMQLVARMDAGPLWAQATVELDGSESKQTLTNELLEAGAELIIEMLPTILDGQARPMDQDEARATTDERLTKTDGHLDWSKPAAVLEREVRAYLGWPGSYGTVAGRDVIVTRSQVNHEATLKVGAARLQNHQLLVGTGDGNLAIERLKPAGKRDMTAAEFAAGIPELR